ncbi:dTDP-4-dehydrorhamnose 3,5-epimerase family protein [Streptomyces avicenniae]|uniref:dTDP-4-dehydrorhamnose 3,5-epimerase family protein n=1 Tax=Streptomyces avicenniae TaxID=500153 RepID=UPI00069C20EF|nr:dTDP-4-dehydrorhamnose 3,5-epimerase family protein [Streptomyces avicenniae]
MAEQIRQLPIPGVCILDPKPRRDIRGHLDEWYRGDLGKGGLRLPFVAQANCTVSNYGVLRGLAVTVSPLGHAKVVTCVQGAVLDVTVDLRPGSPTFGQWHSELLTEDNRLALRVTHGIGHAYLSLAPRSVVIYLLSHSRRVVREQRVQALDSALALPWPDGMSLVQSDRDRTAPAARVALATGLLAAPVHGHTP